MTTASITGFLGCGLGAEWRRGTYGDTVETGAFSPPYFQAPTLVMPVAIDITLGVSKPKSPIGAVGFIVPIVDPAAFLAYDVAEGGRLPGPRPLTALAPGFGVRLAFAGTPFTLMGYGMFRPGLRTWEPTVNGPGAHAIQVLVSLGVDLTLVKFKSFGE